MGILLGRDEESSEKEGTTGGLHRIPTPYSAAMLRRSVSVTSGF
jgi:hypothetical protein